MVLVHEVYMSNPKTEITSGKLVQKKQLIIVRETPLCFKHLCYKSCCDLKSKVVYVYLKAVNHFFKGPHVTKGHIQS